MIIRFFTQCLFFTLCLLSLSIFFVETPLFADDVGASPTAATAINSANSTSKTVTAMPPIDLTTSLFSMLKGLAICIALLLAVVWVLKKVKSPIVSGHGRNLKILERLPVSAKSSIMLVEVNKKKVLIGVGSDPVSLISDFVDSESLGDLSVEANKGDSNEK